MSVDRNRRRISTETLRRYFDVLMAHLEDAGRGTVPLPDDYYWDVPPRVMYDVYKKPSRDLTIGQISEDLEFLDQCVDDPEMVVPYALVWPAHVLKAVGSARIAP